jgi:hypothetical protein
MRNDQPGLVDHEVPVQDLIQIQRSRCAGVRSYTPGSKLDRKKRVEEVARGQIGGPDRGAIQKAWLIPYANWIGVVKGRDLKVVNYGGE